MTFYEAAVRVLEEAGAALHNDDIVKRSIDKGFLSHVGRTPELTMLSRLAAMAKRPGERKIMVTAKDTFALTDWMLPENPEALTQTGVFGPPEEASLPPYRTTERHPEARAEYLRSIGRQADRKRRDEEARKRKFPPLPEVTFELLTECKGALTPPELLARIKAADLAKDDLSTGRLIDALAQDNQSRLEQDRRPAFACVRSDGGELQLSLEPGAEGGPTPLEVQTEFCKAAGLRFEDGKLHLRTRGERSDRSERGAAGLPSASVDDLAAYQAAKTAVRDARRALARAFRRELAELDTGTFERACVKLLHAHHFRELKVAKRSKDGPLLTARRRDGSLELRYAIRLLKGNTAVDRRMVQEIRRDLAHHAAHVALVVSPGEARGDARSDATQGALVMLWCGDALAEKFFDGEVGVTAASVQLFELDPAFFEKMKTDAEESQRRREERHKDRDQRRGGRRDEEEGEGGVDASSADGAAPEVVAAPAAAEKSGDESEEGDDEGDEGEEGGAEAAEGAGEVGPDGVRKKRRRRRRRRRGARPEGEAGVQAAGAEGAPAADAPAQGAAEAAPAPSAPAPSAPSAPQTPPAPPATPSGGGEAGSA